MPRSFFLLLLPQLVLSLQVGVAIFPEIGHLNPILSIVHSAVRRDHHLSIFCPDFLLDHCKKNIISPTGRIECIGLGDFPTLHYDEAFFRELVLSSPLESFLKIQAATDIYNEFLATALLSKLQSLEALPDLLLVDTGSWAATAVADVLNLPTILVWPLTLQLPFDLFTATPALGSSLSRHMTLTDRVFNFLLQRAVLLLGAVRQSRQNEIRALVNASPVDQFDLYHRRLLVTPSLLGLDLAQPLCPSVQPVGFLQPSLENQSLDPEWSQWLDSCPDLVYINMGSVAVLPEAWLLRIAAAVASVHSTSPTTCFCWKLNNQNHGPVLKILPNASTVRLTHRLPFSPRLLLRHGSCRVFVTHCGDTSVYESLEAGVPLVGIPLFADQSDVCARVVDAGVGRSLDKHSFTPAELGEAVRLVASDQKTRQRANQLSRMGRLMGGPERVVDLIELAAANPDLVRNFVCPHLDNPWYQLYDLDLAATLAFSVVLVLLAAKLTPCCR